jgi:methylated-DNA-protein-cysteine methyltransferase-like protein
MAATDSYRKIWEQAALVPEGQVASYGQIAKLAGLPRRAARMVGRALGAAPREMNLPWHRIVNAQGCIAIPKGTARYQQQHELLESEGIEVNDGQLNMDQYRWDPSLDELLWGPGMLRDPGADDAAVADNRATNKAAELRKK